MLAFNSPLASYISNQDGYSRTGVLKVKSQRPRKGFALLLGAEESIGIVAPPRVNRNPQQTAKVTNKQNLLCPFIALRLLASAFYSSSNYSLFQLLRL